MVSISNGKHRNYKHEGTPTMFLLLVKRAQFRCYQKQNVQAALMSTFYVKSFQNILFISLLLFLFATSYISQTP